ncbi:S8 family serine peptidase [Mesorhizobium sp. AA23]|uniref:S8 family peptidase n=1 Tax=Mesorhizobium sp. AA23 TaxID=1854058 RepID=UPI0008008BDF|nr:S8 family serine peptidase [Mesorhizobium sp. AA23]OBQ91386.1 hypothetical protein A9K66_13230 [Mesorhizobium sp. AA23]
MTDDIKKGEGHLCYDWYHYLWHLIAIGALRDRARIPETRLPHEAAYLLEADAWDLLATDKPGYGEVIAQIDTGVNSSHPNLDPRIRPAVSFAAHPFGLSYVTPKQQPAVLRGPEKQQSKSFVGDDTWAWAEGLIKSRNNAQEVEVQKSLLRALKDGRGVIQETAETSRMRYSAHGTACAGLMVGAPEASPAKLRQFGNGEGAIPYWGAAPGAELLPIEISARPDAAQLILAFLYARDQKVSVIHFPREVPDPWRAHRSYPGHGDSRYTSVEQAKPIWDYFEKLFEAISEEIPIICAAGNDGYDHLIYPASKAGESNGVIAVAAVTYRARRSAYSNYSGDPTDNSVTISAPSDDQEVCTRCQIRLDRESPRSRDHNFDIYEKLPQVEYAPQGVLTTDIPGYHGYSGGQLEGIQPPTVESRDRAGLYTVFGGTSAASAIVAGAAALLQSKHRSTGRPLNGIEVKAKMIQSGAKEVSWPWLEKANVPILPDSPNCERRVPSFDQQFGAGLLDLRKLLS